MVMIVRGLSDGSGRLLDARWFGPEELQIAPPGMMIAEA
jgi:hypothetical protein